MATKRKKGPQTAATVFLKKYGVYYEEYLFTYVEHGGATHSAEVLGLDPYMVIKTLVMQDEAQRPLIVLMHGNRKVSTKILARQIGVRSVEPCEPGIAERHSGYLVGGTSPFGLAHSMSIYMESTILDLPKIAINGGRRGFLIAIEPSLCVHLLSARPVQCALPL